MTKPHQLGLSVSNPGQPSFAFLFSFCSASLFICSFICEYFLNTFASPWRSNCVTHSSATPPALADVSRKNKRILRANYPKTVAELAWLGVVICCETMALKPDELICAAGCGDASVVQALLAKGWDVNGKWPDGVTALILASADGHGEVVQTLLAKGADVNSATNDGLTALILAAKNGHRAVVQMLLANGAESRNPKDAEVVQRLLAMEEEARRNPMPPAKPAMHVNSRATKFIEVLNVGGILGGTNGSTDLQAVARLGNVDAVKAFINDNPDVVLRKQKDGKTALHLAAARGRTDWVAALISAGAKINEKDGQNDSWTPLMFAAAEGQADCVKALISAGADVHAEEEWRGLTALMLAAMDGDLANEEKFETCNRVGCIKALIAAGADVNRRDRARNTPLLRAAIYEHFDCAVVLVSAGANVNVKLNDDSTALWHAVRHGARACVEALLSAGAHPGVWSGGMTPLMLARQTPVNRDIEKLLIAAGATE